MITHPVPPADGPVRERLDTRVSTIGTDTTIRRALPHRARRLVGAWCFLDHAGPVDFAADRGLHVGAHPHIGLQTFTWMIAGEVMHRDSLGNAQVITPGQVNLMTAGRGIAHSEDSVHDGGHLHTAQLWIALPEAERQRAPAFRNYPDLPRLQQDGFALTVLVGTAQGQTSPVEVFSPLLGLNVQSTEAARSQLALQPHFEHAVLVLRGSAVVDGERLEPGTLLYLGTQRSTLDLATDGACELLLIGGEPLNEAVLIWWNFVGRSQAEIAQARQDWLDRSPRFGTVEPGSLGPDLVPPSLDGVQLRS